MPSPQICLASQSPRRRQLLEQIGIDYEAVALDVEEAARANEGPLEYVRRLALEKARAGWNRAGLRRGLPVLGADTAVVLDGRVLGKPADRAEAMTMLGLLSGREHQVLTGVALVAEREVMDVNVSRVRLREISTSERVAYWASGEPRDKAGGYAIQGLGAVFVSHIEGSYSGVMGLPLYETVELLRTFAIQVPMLAGAPQ
jgi:septum formation protein